MFGLFSTARQKALKQANGFFKNQYSELYVCDDERIGLILDTAADIKMGAIVYASKFEKSEDYIAAYKTPSSVSPEIIKLFDTIKWTEKIYTNPFSVSEEICLTQLEIFNEKMISWTQEAIMEARQIEGVSPWKSRAREKMRVKEAGLSIWYFSLVAGCFGEFRENGVLLWNQIKRGYPHAKIFIPQRDEIKNLADAPS